LVSELGFARFDEVGWDLWVPTLSAKYAERMGHGVGVAHISDSGFVSGRDFTGC